jgi:2-(3-amino-3-carboxypropyl)histidine synthase
MNIPDEILLNDALNEQIARSLPSNYKFEVHKTLWRIQQAKATCVAMQFPEGLLLYAPLLADILQKFANVETIIMADVAYGACCIDDYSAVALGADFLVHYGHSCLVPIDRCVIKNAIYVFVEISIDVKHFIDTVKFNIPSSANCAIAGTIQFVAAIHQGIDELKQHFEGGNIFVPQAKPLSKGEILGCTAPSLPENIDTIVFLSDGRFHLEALMIQNPQVKNVYKYDPYIKKLTVEQYSHDEMHQMRQEAIEIGKKAKKFGLILGTLGRQGNPEILTRLEKMLEDRSILYVSVLLSEILPHKMNMFDDVDW